MKNNQPYLAFGKMLISLRQQVGISQQSDLALLVKTTQQTVSRWEAGISRPRPSQMQLLADVLKTNVEDLLVAAGHGGTRVVTSFDQPFPVDALSPETFERFCLYFLDELYPKADVHRVGGSGHTQGGVDIEVVFPDKTCFSFQCKRVAEFGPQKIHVAVAEHKRKAKKKFIVLSRVASPQARLAIQRHSGWDIWDKEDISKRVRELSRDEQRRLVDIFFPGQRLALLGINEAGPWQTTDEFFAPFMNERAAFNHAWDLVGRTDEADRLSKALLNDQVAVILLVAPGGTGKTRLLKQVVETLESKGDVKTSFLLPTEDVTQKSLEELGAATKLLVVDDAHDRDDLQLLFRFTATPSNRVKLLLALRPYALGSIQGQIHTFAFSEEHVVKVELGRPTLDQATTLAVQGLQRFGGPAELAQPIARLTIDSPLATLLSACIVAKEKLPLELAKNNAAFRDTIMGKFCDVIAGDVGGKGESEQVKRLLGVLSLLQPVNPDDLSLYEIIEKVEGLPIPTSRRLIRLLSDGGILLRRGGRLRLSPDVLADYIVEEKCIGPDRRSSGYAECAFEAAPDVYVKPLLLNLGKVDWLITSGDPAKSSLLDGIWAKLRATSQYADPHVAAVSAVAYYQPSRALDFADRLIREGKNVHELADLIRNAAYNIEYLHRSCQSLWELSKTDKREPHQHPEHPIRILADLCAVQKNKPLTYNEIVVDYMLSLLKIDDSWNYVHSPFDVLKGILRTEGDDATFTGNALRFSPFLVLPASVAGLRRKVIDATVAMFAHPNTKIAVLVAGFVSEALRYPVGLFGTVVPDNVMQEWTEEFVQTLTKIEAALENKKVDTLVLVEVLRSISTHSRFGDDRTASIVQKIHSLAADSLDFRVTLALIDGYGHRLLRKDPLQYEREWNKELDKLVADVKASFPEPEKLYVFIEERLSHMVQYLVGTRTSPHVLIWRLMDSSLSFAKAIAANALNNPASVTVQFAGAALAVVLWQDHSLGLEFAHKFLSQDQYVFDVAVSEAFGRYAAWGKGTNEELEILRTLLKTTKKIVAAYITQALRHIANKNPRLSIELLKEANLAASSEFADEMLMFFEQNKAVPFELLAEEDVASILKSLLRLPAMDGYWIQSFLSNASKRFARETARFLMGRVDYAVTEVDWYFRPCNYGPYSNVPLRFRESVDFRAVFKDVIDWTKAGDLDNGQFLHLAAELFGAAFQPFDEVLVRLMTERMQDSASTDIRIIAEILRNAHNTFVFEHQSFVISFLDAAARQGTEILDAATSSLWSSSISGTRMGSVGEPFPQDLKMRESAEKVLRELPRFSPAFGLYEAILKNAELSIKRSSKEREVLED